MKTIIQIVFVMSLLAAATSVQADPPPGVGSADVTITKEGACLGAFVDVGGASTPILPGGEGLVFVNLEEVVLVYANDRNGNAHLRCHGRIPVGETVLAFDFVTGEEILATLPTVNGACAAIELVFPEACRGRGAIIFNFETTGAFCTIGGVPTPDWHQVTTRNGAANLSCHIGP